MLWKGQLLAEQTIIGPGKEGYNVLGTRLPFKVQKSQDEQLQHNGNVYIEKEGRHTKFFSRISGILYNDKRNLLKVQEELVVQGAVGFQTGNLNTETSVVIEGDVKAGFAIKAGKGITVKGAVEKGAVLESKGEVAVDGGVGPSSVIISERDVHLKFAQGATIKSDACVYVSSYLYDCDVYCGERFYCEGMGSNERGAVIGGSINAFQGLFLKSVGSSNALTTLITGYHKSVREEYEELIVTKDSLQSEIKRLVRQLPVDLLDPNFKTLMKALPEPEKKVCRQKIEQIISNRRECEILGTRISELGPKAKANFLDAKIKVDFALCPDIRIVFPDDYKLVYESFRGVTFQLLNGILSSDSTSETQAKEKKIENYI